MKKIFYFLVLLFIVLYVKINGVEAANIGDRLPSPESGWQRIDDRHLSIIYDGNIYRGSSSSFSNGTYTHESNVNLLNNTVKFKFYGTKLRLLTYPSNNRSRNIEITIDGDPETFSTDISPYNSHVVVYEKTDLDKKIHEVTIEDKDIAGKYLIMDSIDIDDDGYMLVTSSDIQTGSYIKLGKYVGGDLQWIKVDYNDYLSNDKHPLLMSAYMVDMKQFAAKTPVDRRTTGFPYGDTYWERSTLRDWLNSDERIVSYSSGIPEYYNEKGFLYEWTNREKSFLVPVAQKFRLYDNSSLRNLGLLTGNSGFEYGVSVEKVSIPNVDLGYITAMHNQIPEHILNFFKKKGITVSGNNVYINGIHDAYTYRYNLKDTVDKGYIRYRDGSNWYNIYPNRVSSGSTNYGYVIRSTAYLNKYLLLKGDGTVDRPYEVMLDENQMPAITIKTPEKSYVSIDTKIPLRFSVSTVDGNDIEVSYKLIDIDTNEVIKEETIGKGLNISVDLTSREGMLDVLDYLNNSYRLTVYAKDSKGRTSENSSLIFVRESNPYSNLFE